MNVHLKKIDRETHEYLMEMQIQPELILLKQLRCMFCREFTLNSIVVMWDYIFSGIEQVSHN
jgi:TBC1 domain family protein 5